MPDSTAPIVPAGTIDLSAAISVAAGLGTEGVEVLARLHARAKEERAAEAKTAAMRAMAAFRGEMPAIKKAVAGQHGVTRKGTRTAGMYAPLDVITPILDPIAAKHGFSYRFDRRMIGDKEYVVCVVTHEKGHEIESRFPCPPDVGPGRSSIQAVASGESYAKRYALIAAFAITCADPDDDAEAAGERAPGECITEEQAASIAALLDEAPDREKERAGLLRWVGVETLGAIPAARYAEVVRAVEAKRRKGWKS